MKKLILDSDKPWTSNYPLLEAWLRKHDMHCVWQETANPHQYVEMWTTLDGRTCIVLVRDYQRGWDIFTSCDSAHVGATLEDTEVRLGLAPPRPLQELKTCCAAPINAPHATHCTKKDTP